MTLKKFFTLIGAIAICQIAGLIGTPFSINSIPNWYSGLVKPMLNPPSWIFGPVWTTLYTLMGISLYIVWQKRNSPFFKRAITLFSIQLVLNAAWSIIFFGAKLTGWALVDISLMWVFIVATIFSFSKISKAAAWLLVPYILWVSFALYLNLSIWRLN